MSDLLANLGPYTSSFSRREQSCFWVYNIKFLHAVASDSNIYIRHTTNQLEEVYM